ncbi:MAG: FAD-dependent monooxygenase [Hyphomicrobium sp.]|jgi:2-octaprenyl-6-methoxyphenol hydroxylase
MRCDRLAAVESATAMSPEMSPDMKPERFDVIISGASFAGVALARALRLALGDALKIALVDRARKLDEPTPDARAFALSAASKRMLDRLGVWHEIAPAAQPVTAIDITDSSLEAAVRPIILSYDNHLDRAEPATFIVPAKALEQALYASIGKDAALTFIAPAEAESFTAGEFSIEVALKDRPAISAALLIGAEGRRSASREAAGIKTVGWSYGQIAIVTTIAHSIPHGGRATQHFLPGGPFALLPLLGNRSCITWSEEEKEARRILAQDDEGFLAEIEQRTAGRLGTITLAGPRQSWPLEMHLARSYVAPRFAAIGDAAHGVHPIAGQGVNLAFRDVAALAEVLADAARLGLDIGSMQTLEHYERWRRFDSTLSAATFDGINRVFSSDHTLLRAARDFGLSTVDRIPALKSYFVSEAAGTAGSLPRLLKGEPV